MDDFHEIMEKSNEDVIILSSLPSQFCSTIILMEAGISVRGSDIEIFLLFHENLQFFMLFFVQRAISAIFYSFQYHLEIFRNKVNKMHDTKLCNHLFHNYL